MNLFEVVFKHSSVNVQNVLLQGYYDLTVHPLRSEKGGGSCRFTLTDQVAGCVVIYRRPSRSPGFYLRLADLPHVHKGKSVAVSDLLATNFAAQELSPETSKIKCGGAAVSCSGLEELRTEHCRTLKETEGSACPALFTQLS